MIHADLVEKLMPPDNHIQVLGSAVWLLNYKNTAKRRITFELVGILFPARKKAGEDKRFDVQLVDSGKVFTIEEFEAYRRKTWPAPHEKNRNPENATLGVHSGVGKSIGGFK